MSRRYKPVADRLRPQDRMIAHTGFLIFARAIVKPPPAAAPQPANVEAGDAADSDNELDDNDVAAVEM